MSMFRNLSETNKLLKFLGKTIWQLKATLMEIWLYTHGSTMKKDAQRGGKKTNDSKNKLSTLREIRLYRSSLT